MGVSAIALSSLINFMFLCRTMRWKVDVFLGGGECVMVRGEKKEGGRQTDSEKTRETTANGCRHKVLDGIEASLAI